MAIKLEDKLQHYPDALMIEPMLINKIPKGKEHMLSEVCSNGEYFGQLKVDGYLYIYEKTAESNYLFSRTVSRVNGCLGEKGANVPHIMSALDVLPPKTVVLGEIYYKGGTSKNVTEVMGCLEDKAIARQNEKGLIHFYIYDILYYDGYCLLNTPALTRYKVLEKIYELHGFSQYDYLELAQSIYTNIEEKINEYLANGEEGMVLKRKDGLYTPGKRPAWNTLKVKQSDTTDCIITGFCNPTKDYTGTDIENWEYWEEKMEDDNWRKCKGLYCKDYKHNPNFYRPITKHFFYGWKNAIEVSAYNEQGALQMIGTISSGLTDELRESFATTPDKYLGSVCEVQCMSLDSKEKTIRHGFFKGFRPDKNDQDCTLQTIFK